MNKEQLIEAISETAGITKADSERAINAFTKILTRCFKKKEKVMLVGFGNFEAKKTKARKGRNPKTGQEIPIPPRMKVKFNTGSDLLKELNKR